MFKRILAFIDYSKKNSYKNVIPVANDLAIQNSAELNIMTVVPDFGSSMVSQFFDEDFDEEEPLKKILADLKGFINDNIDSSIKTRPIVATGKARNQVPKTAKKLGVDLIVISPSRNKAKINFGMGATTSDIVRHAQMSVLVVR